MKQYRDGHRAQYRLYSGASPVAWPGWMVQGTVSVMRNGETGHNQDITSIGTGKGEEEKLSAIRTVLRLYDN